MKTATAVIGASFGDEGKGHLVDYFAHSSSNPLVIRYCGGANAGHTVETPEGVRHVFGHFGAGTLAGAPTFLSKFFLVNPVLWKREAEELAEINMHPRVLVDPQALLSTPYDVLINQYLETARAGAHHGSVGVGINETMVRSKAKRYRLTAEEMALTPQLRKRLIIIRDEYVPARIDELGLELTPRQQIDLESDGPIDLMINAIQWLLTGCDWEFATVGSLRGYDIIFEGSQGLLLDAVNGPFFPHVTNARTGAANVMQLAGELGIDQVFINYVIRPYATRHGAGPFPSWQPGLAFADETNVRNQWQGGMRFGWHDLDLLEAGIMKDLGDVSDLSKVTWSLSVTCLNQVDGIPPQFCMGGEHIVHEDWTWSQAADFIRSRIGGDQMALNSYGKTRDTIMPVRRSAA